MTEKRSELIYIPRPKSREKIFGKRFEYRSLEVSYCDGIIELHAKTLNSAIQLVYMDEAGNRIKAFVSIIAGGYFSSLDGSMQKMIDALNDAINFADRLDEFLPMLESDSKKESDKCEPVSKKDQGKIHDCAACHEKNPEAPSQEWCGCCERWLADDEMTFNS